MRKIISKEKYEKKRKRNQLIVGGMLIFIMLFGILGYGFQGADEEKNNDFEYNGFKFIEQNVFWKLNIGNYNFIFKHTPLETENLSIQADVKPLNNYYGYPLYIYSENKEVETEIYQNLYQVVQRVQFACPDKNETDFEPTCEESLPIKDCSNNLIIIREDENVLLRQQNNCVFIQGPREDLIKVSEEFLFKILGVK